MSFSDVHLQSESPKLVNRPRAPKHDSQRVEEPEGTRRNITIRDMVEMITQSTTASPSKEHVSTKNSGSLAATLGS